MPIYFLPYLFPTASHIPSSHLLLHSTNLPAFHGQPKCKDHHIEYLFSRLQKLNSYAS